MEAAKAALDEPRKWYRTVRMEWFPYKAGGDCDKAWQIFKKAYGRRMTEILGRGCFDLEFAVMTVDYAVQAIERTIRSGKIGRSATGRSEEQLRAETRRANKAKLRFRRLAQAGMFEPTVFEDMMENGVCPEPLLDLFAFTRNCDSF
jgi:hypothetical protein